MEQLKELLGEELYSQLVAKLGDKKLVVDDGKLIPKYRLDEVSEKNKSLSEQLQKYEGDLKTLKQTASGNEELTKQISDLQKKMKEQQEEAEAKMIREKKSFALKDALRSAGVQDDDALDVLSKKFDVDKIELDETGKPKGFDDAIKPLKEKPAFSAMFGKKQISGQEHQHGLDPQLGEWAGDKNPFSKKGLNITKQIELKRTNPDLASKLEKLAQ
jgi:predicted transcriptional regulator